MDWDHLRVFLAIARRGQILAAARGLGLNHATVARRLNALEDSLGIALFERRPSGSTLTRSRNRRARDCEGTQAWIAACRRALLIHWRRRGTLKRAVRR